jgi:uncharacterized LabA/DUF88 family protein
MRVAIFADAANMFYAQRENGWQIDFKKVYELFDTDYEVRVAYYFTGTPYYEKTLEIESYRKFKNFLIRIGYRIVEKEVKRIKRKLPEDVLINGKRLKDIIKK